MVNSWEKAIRIQKRRKAAGKIGLAKAVLRWLRRTGEVADCRLG